MKPQPNLHACAGASANPLSSYVGGDELDKVLTYASEAIGAGVNDWNDLTRGVPANWLPRILGEWVDWCLDLNQLPRALTEAWVSCEAAEQALSRERWIRCFRALGSRYVIDGAPAVRPDWLELYRGGGRYSPGRMTWTPDRATAERFREATPYGRGALWSVTVPGDRVLGQFTRTGGGYVDGEIEVVIDPEGIDALKVG